MSFSFSEEGMFFIQNWGTIEKLLNSLQNFRSEFSNYLYSVEKMLKTKNWWSEEELVFRKRDQRQVYISKKGWSDDDITYYIWIGKKRKHFTISKQMDQEKISSSFN